MGETGCPTLRGLCGAMARVNTDGSGRVSEDKAYLGLALSSVLGRHGRGVQGDLFEAPCLRKCGQGARHAGQSHELFLAEGFGVCDSVH